MSRRKITDANGFRAMKSLEKAAADPRVDEIEGNGCDDGRVLIHLIDGYWFEHYETVSKGVGSAEDVRDAMAMIRPRPEVTP
jgi:hypothetical protein